LKNKPDPAVLYSQLSLKINLWGIVAFCFWKTNQILVRERMIKMRITIIKMVPIAVSTQTHTGTAGVAGGGAGMAGTAFVVKLKVADQSLGIS